MGTQTGAIGADTPASDAQGHLTGYGTKAYRSYVLNALLFCWFGLISWLDIPILQQISQATVLAAMTLPSFAGIGFGEGGAAISGRSHATPRT